MLRIFVFSLGVFWILAADAQSASANGDPSLYSGWIPAVSKTEQERRGATPSALLHVLQKLSGERDLSPSPGLDEALSNAEQFLLAYHYEDHDRVMSDGERLPETWLIVQFQPASVDRLVMELGLKRWRKDRPALRMWVVIDDGLGRRLLPLEYAYIQESMNWVAAQRGLPVSWPDAEISESLDLQLLWGGFTEQIPPATGASGGDVVISARRVGPQWQLRWNFDNGLETLSWRTEGRNLSLATAEGLHRLTDSVAASNSIRGDLQGDWVVVIGVGGLNDASAYAQCLNYLESLGLTDDVRVVQAEPGRVQFELALNADPAYLADILRRDGFLVPEMSPGAYRILSGSGEE